MDLSISQGWQTFSTEEQQILSCLTPFQGIIYYDYTGLQDYFKPLEPWQIIPEDPYVIFYPLLQKAINLGLLNKTSSEWAFLNIQSDFNFFLRTSVWKKQTTELKAAVINSFLNYYQMIATDLYEKIKSGEPTYYQEALNIISLEYSNFIEATRLGIKLDKEIFTFISILGKYFNHHQYLSTWLSFLFSLEKQIKKGKDNAYFTTYISILDYIGITYLNLSQPKEAEHFFLKALKACEKSKHEKSIIDNLKSTIYNNLGNAATERNQQIMWQQKAFTIVKKTGNTIKIGSVAYNLSEALFQTKDIPQSRKYLEVAINSFIKNGDFYGQIKAYQSMAAHFRFSNQFTKAEENLKVALLVAQTIVDTYQEATIYQELASIYYYQNNLTQAMSYCKKAIPIFVEAGDIRKQANAYNLLSIAAFEATEFEDGYTYAYTALQLFHQTDDKSQMAQTYGNLALIAYKNGDYEECLSFLKTNMSLYSSIDEQFNLEKSRLLKTSAYCGLEQFNKAKRELLKALSFFTKLANEIEIEHCWRLGNFIYRETEDEDFKLKMETIATGFLEEKE